MRIEKDFKANRKLTLLFLVIMVLGIASLIARQSRVGKSLGESALSDSQPEPSDSADVLVTRAGPLLHSEWGRDPFARNTESSKSPAAKGKRKPRFTLTAIIADRENSAAVIDGEVYRTGEVVKGFVIQEISPGSVTLKRSVETLVLVF